MSAATKLKPTKKERKEMDKDRHYTHDEMLQFDRERVEAMGPKPRQHFQLDADGKITLPDGIYRIENGKIYPGDAPVHPKGKK